jgi:hypothetical protein
VDLVEKLANNATRESGWREINGPLFRKRPRPCRGGDRIDAARIYGFDRRRGGGADVCILLEQRCVPMEHPVRPPTLLLNEERRRRNKSDQASKDHKERCDYKRWAESKHLPAPSCATHQGFGAMHL